MRFLTENSFIQGCAESKKYIYVELVQENKVFLQGGKKLWICFWLSKLMGNNPVREVAGNF